MSIFNFLNRKNSLTRTVEWELNRVNNLLHHIAVSQLITVRKLNQGLTIMGELQDQLKQIENNLNEASTELLAEIEKLRKSNTLSDEDRATLNRIGDKAKGLADIVPNAPTEATPAPESTPEVATPETPAAEAPVNPEAPQGQPETT